MGKGAGHLAFRPDIEGLRAVAVLLILFNHLGIRGFSGGFIGVDIFFVISGYLITAIWLRDVHHERASIAAFYRRRILRIFPALFPLLLFTTVMAWFFIAPGELVLYARSLLATLFFASNFAFHADTGYFTLNATVRPLLHTWSLAIEEQFYIFWPLLLSFCAARGRTALIAAISGVILLSLALSIWMVATDMSAAFYLIPFRAWELALGGALALVPALDRLPSKLREALAWVGIALILACANRYHELSTPFPGLAATLPCLGTALLILSGPHSLPGKLLALPVARFFGQISYSLYLWHWPVIVFTRLTLWPMHDPRVIAADLLLSVLLGWLSYHLFEQRGRRLLAPLPARHLFAGAALATALGAACAGSLIASHGFPQRYSAENLHIAAVLDDDEQRYYRSGSCFLVQPGDRFDARQCLTLQKGKPTLLLVGDSTAAHFWPGLARHAGTFSIAQATVAGCRPQISGPARMPCQVFYNHILVDWLERNPVDTVLLSGNWQASDIGALNDILARLKSRRIKAIVIGPMPRYDTYLARLLFFTPPARRADMAAAHLETSLWQVARAVRETAAQQGAFYIAPTDLLCRSGRCALFAQSATPLQFDDVHLTKEGSEMLVGRMMPVLRTIMAAPNAGRISSGEE